jgi:hypothetical protein
VNAFSLCVDYSDRSLKEETYFMDESELAELFDTVPSLSAAGEGEPIPIYSNNGLPSVLEVDVDDKWEKLGMIESMIESGRLIVPLIDGEALLEESFGEYGYYYYLPYDPSLELVQKDDPYKYDSYTKTAKIMSGLYGSEIDSYAPKEFYVPADIFMQEQEVQGKALPAIQFSFWEEHVGVSGTDFVGVPLVIVERLNEEFNEMEISNCNKPTDDFFWAASRGPLPERLQVNVGGTVCHYQLKESPGVKESHYDPFVDLQETGYIAIRQFPYQEDYAAWTKDRSVADIKADLYANSIANSPWDPSLVRRPDETNIDDLKAFSKFYLEIVPPANLPDCGVDPDSINLAAEEEEGKKLYFADSKYKLMLGEDFLEELDFDEKSIAINSYKVLKEKSGNAFTRTLNRLASGVEGVGVGTVLKEVSPFTSSWKLSALYANKGIRLASEAVSKQAAGAAAIYVESQRMDSLKNILTKYASGDLLDATDDLEKYFTFTRQLSSTEGVKFATSPGGRILPAGISVANIETLDAALKGNLDGLIHGGGAPENLLRSLALASEDVVTQNQFLVAVTNASTDITGELTPDDIVQINGLASSSGMTKFKLAAGLHTSYLAKSARVRRLQMLSEILETVDDRALTGSRHAKGRVAYLAGKAGVDADIGKDALKKVLDAAIDEEKAFKETLEKVSGKWWSKVSVPGNWANWVATKVSGFTDDLILSKGFLTKGTRFAGKYVMRPARGTVKSAIGMVTGGTSIAVGEVAGLALSAGTRGYCLARSKLRGGNISGSVGFGIECDGDADASGIMKEVKCQLFKNYEFPDFFNEYNECMDTAGIKFLRVLSDIVSFTGEPVIGSVLDWGIGGEDSLENALRAGGGNFSDITRIGVYAKPGNCNVNSSSFTYANKTYSVNAGTSSLDDTSEFLISIDEADVDKGCEFFTIFSVRPSSTFLDVMGKEKSPAKLDGFASHFDKVLDPEEYEEIFGTQVNYKREILDITSAVSGSRGSIFDWDEDRFLYLRYGYLIKSEKIKLGEGVSLRDVTEDIVDPVRKKLVLELKLLAGTIIESIKSGKIKVCEDYGWWQEATKKGGACLDSYSTDVLTCFRDKGVAIKDSAKECVTFVENVRDDFKSGVIVDDLAIGYWKGTSFETVAAGKNIIAKSPKVQGVPILQGVPELSYDADKDALVTGDLSNLKYEKLEGLRRSIADGTLKVEYLPGTYTEHKGIIDNLLSNWTETLSGVDTQIDNVYEIVASRLILGYNGPNKSEVIAAGHYAKIFLKENRGITDVDATIKYDRRTNEWQIYGWKSEWDSIKDSIVINTVEGIKLSDSAKAEIKDLLLANR